MPLLWIEGFEIHQGPDWFADKYAETLLTGVTFGDGRLLGTWQGKCLVHKSATAGYLRTPSFGSSDAWSIGLWVEASYCADSVDLVQLRDVSSGNALFTLRMLRRTATQFQFDFLEGGTIRESSEDLDFSTSTGYYFLLEVAIDVSGGLSHYSLYYKEGGSVYMAFSNYFIVSTPSLPTGISIGFGSGSEAETFKLDDIYIATGGGISFGECVVEGLLPNANGTTQEWFGVSGGAPEGNHASLLDDAASGSNHDSDSTYILTSSVDKTDLLGYPSLQYITGGIQGIMIHTVARLEAPGSEDLELRFRDSTGATALFDQLSVDSISYANYAHVAEKDPVTYLAWDVTRFNAAEFGVRTPST